MPKRGTGRKKAEKPKEDKHTVSTDETTVKIQGLEGKIRGLQELNATLTQENAELSRVVNELLAKLDDVAPSYKNEELATIQPDDLVKVRVVKPKFSVTYTDYRGVTKCYNTGDVFEMRRSQLVYQQRGAFEIVDG